ncbi:hypothetical protein BpHYR1_017943 [Brachionus plicatilis]|uniref:Uncharacterized protein n=1 Tax=Brachionus plicatilis TaxID=10195 RepID=A0A3M7Q1I1_BRAPC|nr:hypothetical protein BpHYR1_017943 [Brachionus plicatilis]
MLQFSVTKILRNEEDDLPYSIVYLRNTSFQSKFNYRSYIFHYSIQHMLKICYDFTMDDLKNSRKLGDYF